MPKEITTVKGGIKVKFNEADFLTANKLRSILTQAVKKQGYDMSKLDGLITIEVIDCNSDLVDILFDCLKRCTYAGEKISRDTFEPIEARIDYYEIMMTCLEVNYLPFVQAPDSLLTKEPAKSL